MKVKVHYPQSWKIKGLWNKQTKTSSKQKLAGGDGKQVIAFKCWAKLLRDGDGGSRANKFVNYDTLAGKMYYDRWKH